MFSLATTQACITSQVFFENSERKGSWQNFFETTKPPLSNISKCFYKLTQNGNVKPETLVNTRLLHRYLKSF